MSAVQSDADVLREQIATLTQEVDAFEVEREQIARDTAEHWGEKNDAAAKRMKRYGELQALIHGGSFRLQSLNQQLQAAEHAALLADYEARLIRRNELIRQERALDAEIEAARKVISELTDRKNALKPDVTTATNWALKVYGRLLDRGGFDEEQKALQQKYSI